MVEMQRREDHNNSCGEKFMFAIVCARNSPCAAFFILLTTLSLVMRLSLPLTKLAIYPYHSILLSTGHMEAFVHLYSDLRYFFFSDRLHPAVIISEKQVIGYFVLFQRVLEKGLIGKRFNWKKV